MPRAPNASNTRVVHDVAYSATRFSNRGLARVAAHAIQVLPASESEISKILFDCLTSF